jgi:carboxyl-terminal processing protease
MDNVDFETLIDGAFEGVINSLGDPNSVFFIDQETGQTFVDSATGEYEGIGIGMKMNESGMCEVTSVALEGPASKAGVKPGDIIVGIDGISLNDKSLIEISTMLRGRVGTTVRVTIQRGGAEQVLTMTREKIQNISVFYEILEEDIGYILLTGFGINGAEQFNNARNQLISRGAKSLIIDLRDNPGGIVGTAVAIADSLLPGGDIVHIRHKGEIVETETARVKNISNMPIAVLINENSASASEILAAALKGNNAAVLVGTTTYGKGTAQIVGYTSNGRAYRISVFYFLTPDKEDINIVGIAPDHPVRNALGELREAAAEVYSIFAPVTENTVYRAGEVGLNVFGTQQRLALLGYEVEINAVMDEATVAAVSRFQREYGLYAAGVLDITTKNKIDEAVLAYINNDSDEDLQLKKAIEVLR